MLTTHNGTKLRKVEDFLTVSQISEYIYISKTVSNESCQKYTLLKDRIEVEGFKDKVTFRDFQLSQLSKGVPSSTKYE
jgi:hypothetical protein